MRKTIKKMMAWVLTFSMTLALIPAFDVSALAAKTTDIAEVLNLLQSIVDTTSTQSASSTVQISDEFRAEMISRYDIDVEMLTLGEYSHGSIFSFSNELSSFENSQRFVPLSESQQENILLLISGGYTNSQAYAAAVTSKLLNIPIKELILAKQEEIESKNQENQSNSPKHLSEEDIDYKILSTSIKLGVPYAVIERYMSAKGESSSTLVERFLDAFSTAYPNEATESGSVTTSSVATTSTDADEYDPESILTHPYSYGEVGDISVNLNTGSFSYSEVDLSLPGKNGLDVNFVRRFQSEYADVQIPYACRDTTASLLRKTAFTVVYQPYVYHDGELSEVDDIDDYDLDSSDIADIEAVVDTSVFHKQDGLYTADFSAKNYNAAARAVRSLEPIVFSTTETASSESVKIIYVGRLQTVEPNFLDAFFSLVKPYNFYVDSYGLGHGWSFGFSSIEFYPDGINPDLTERTQEYLITRDGNKYEIDFSGAHAPSYLVGYKSSDMVMDNSGGNVTGASYTLTYKDGTKEYFNDKGKLILITDRFHNSIMFEYQYDPEDPDVVTQITILDTLNRIIVYRHTNETYNPDMLPEINSPYAEEYDDGYYAYNGKWELLVDNELIKTYYTRTYDALPKLSENGSSYQHQDLIAVQDAVGDITEYHYIHDAYQLNNWVTVPSPNDELKAVTNLSYIIAPNGVMTELWFESSKHPKRLGRTGYSEYTYLTDYAACDATSAVGYYDHLLQYTYGDHSQMTDEYLISLTTDCAYHTTLRERHNKIVDSSSADWLGLKYDYSFSHDTHHKKTETISAPPFIQYEDVNESTTVAELREMLSPYTSLPVQVTEYSRYDSITNLPELVEVAYYNRGESAPDMTATYEYEYDNKGNITEEVYPNGLIVTRTYDSRASLPLTTTYDPAYSSGTFPYNTLPKVIDLITETNTLNSNGTAIVSSETTVKYSDNTSAVVTNRKTTYTYDDRGRMLTQKDYRDSTDYTETKYAYGSYASPASITVEDVRDADGAAASGTFAANGNGNFVERYTYNNKGWLISHTDAAGNTTSYQYDAVGRITRVTNPDSSYATYVYNIDDNTVVYTDERGTALRYEYDLYGNNTGIYDIAGNQYLSEYVYGSFGWLVQEIQHAGSNKGDVTTYHHDASGRVTMVKTEDFTGTLTSKTTYEYTYDNTNAALHEDGIFKTTKTIVGDDSAPSIVTTTYEDNMGNTVQTGRFLGNREYLDTYTYDDFGNMLTECSAYSKTLGHTYTQYYLYDASGNVIAENDRIGTTEYTFDWLGNCTAVKDPLGYTKRYVYDDLGRLIQQKQPYSGSGTSTVYSLRNLYYDKSNNLIREKTTNNLPSATTSWTQTDYAYSNRDFLTQVTSYDNGVIENMTRYAYDHGGNLLQMKTGLSSASDTTYATTSYTYDRFGNTLTTTTPLNKTGRWAYNLDGTLQYSLSPDGRKMMYTYYGLQKVGGVVGMGGARAIRRPIVHSLTGAVTSDTLNNYAVTYEYDSLGRKIKESAGSTIQSYTYGIDDQLDNYTLTVNNVVQVRNTYTHDARGLLTSVTDKDNNQTTYIYDANRRITRIDYPNGTRAAYTYNQANLPTKVTYTNYTGGTVGEIQYTYTLDGNIATETVTGGRAISYEYDDLGRLTREVIRPTSSGTISQQYVYTYDDFGNRATLTATGTNAFTVTYTYDLENHLLSEAKTASGVTTTTTYTYDTDGNLLTKNTGNTGTTVSYTYDTSNAVVQMTVGGAATTYLYLPSGLRYQATMGSTVTNYVWDGSNMVLEYQGSTVLGRYVYGDRLLTSQVSGYSDEAYLAYLYNGHGDVVKLVGDGKNTVREYIYDAFGNQSSPVSTDANPFRYGGQYYDKSTGNYYLRARYYDPVIGRFTREDPHWNTGNMIYGDDPVELAGGAYAPSLEAIIQSGNRYPYAMNNPVKYTDENGEAVLEILVLAGLYDGLTTGGMYMLSGKGFARGFTNGFTSGLTTAGVAMIGAAAGPSGAYIGGVLGSSIGSAMGSLVEDVLWHRNEKSMDDMVLSAAKSAATGLIVGLPATHIEHAVNFATDIAFVADELMEYDAYLGEALQMFFTALEEMLKVEMTMG